MRDASGRFVSRRNFVADGVRLAAGVAAVPMLSPVRLARHVSMLAPPDEIGDLEQLIPRLMKQANVPGVSIAVIKDAKVVWHRGFGVRDAASAAPVDDHTAFEAASVSKTVFAYAAMQLCDRGTLSLDKPLTEYTADRIVNDDPRLDLITARRVLSHTTGLPNFRSRDNPLSIHFAPGDRFEYSGEGYWYLQSIITHLVGKVDPNTCKTFEAGMTVCATDIADYLAANVLRPLGMRDSSYVWNDTLARDVARPHDENGKPLPLSKTTATDAARYAAMGGLRTTALDYAKFLIEILAPHAPPGVRLSARSRTEMLRPQVKVDQSKDWALGWQIERTPRGSLIQHEGGQTGFLAFTAASVERRTGYVIFTNGANGWKIFFNDEFGSLARRILLGSPS